MTDFHNLERARTDLHEARTEARLAAKRLLLEYTQDAQQAVDLAVLEAVNNGATKTSIAAFLGESRTTINERLARVTDTTKPNLPTLPQIMDVAPPYEVSQLGDDTVLVVDWHDYGPQHVSGQGQLLIIRDDDEDDYWFMVNSGVGADEAVADVLDTSFSGWYYADALAFVTQALNEEE